MSIIYLSFYCILFLYSNSTVYSNPLKFHLIFTIIAYFGWILLISVDKVVKDGADDNQTDIVYIAIIFTVIWDFYLSLQMRTVLFIEWGL